MFYSWGGIANVSPRDSIIKKHGLFKQKYLDSSQQALAFLRVSCVLLTRKHAEKRGGQKEKHNSILLSDVCGSAQHGLFDWRLNDTVEECQGNSPCPSNANTTIFKEMQKAAFEVHL